MIVYRIVKPDFSNDISGEGARLYGGRWNSKGVRALYTSQYRSLSVLELAVHVHLSMFENSFSLVTIEIPDKLEIIDFKGKLPDGWEQYPLSFKTQKYGDKVLLNPHILGIKVPSAIVHEECNIILNPLHSEYHKIKIKKVRNFNLDGRLLV